MAQNYYESFKKKLEEIFMMDHAELDFGIYRIMNQKRNDIQRFLNLELLPQVKQVLEGNNGGANKAKIRMAEIAASVGGNIEVLPKGTPMRDEYDKLEVQLAQSADTESMQAEVFSHLVTFFSRYYDGGDFLSKRRYKDTTYAIPYNGEEVKLHWANSDQYYIKTSEYFRDYTFVLPTSRKKVHFVLKDASTEQNNNRAANNMERRFALLVPENNEPIVETTADGELNIYFTYELMPKATKQKDLLAAALEGIKPLVPTDFEEVLTAKAPTKDNANRTLLEKHLTDYTAKNSFDYFIHKDLGGFLRRELDFYIKNEVLHIDDLDAQLINSQLTIVRAIKQVGEKIIRMLAQLENFQRKLWLKKKFVVQSDYCITLDRVPEKLYPEIIANEAQRKEWVRLFAIDEIKGDMMTEGYSEPLTIEFLKQNPFLVLDTAFFSKQFKHKLVTSMENVDRDCNGLLINSENFQALELLQEKFSRSVNCTYIDPPYNTGNDGFLYKDGYSHSSWLTLMNDRILISKPLFDQGALFFASTDDNEICNFRNLCANQFGKDKFEAQIIVQSNKRGQTYQRIAKTHEYLLCYTTDNNSIINEIEKEISKNSLSDNIGNYELWELRNRNPKFNSSNRPNLYYPIYVKIDCLNKDGYALVSANKIDGAIAVFPLNSEGAQSCWRWGRDKLSIAIESGYDVVVAKQKKDGGWNIYEKARKDTTKAKTIWDETSMISEQGTTILGDMGITEFAFPKPVELIKKVELIGSEKDSLILDYYGGSGTTVHATISLNREDGGTRKFLLVEMGDYFKTVTLERVNKVIYSQNWRDGKPVSRDGISQCFKYIRLEQYEDTLNNLKIKEQQTTARFDEGSGFKESYMLEYMLDTETRDSLLNLKMFENPFAMTLKTTKDNELVETEVDMVETFNYLIGLNVETEDWYRDENICVVQGHTHRDNLHTLVIWRNCKEIDNEQLNQFFERMDFRTRDSEFDLIYVNGDNLLPNLRRDEENWKVVLTEEEFIKRMFETE